MNKLLKLTLAVLFLLCLLDMPYGYFQLVRILAMAGFTYLAYDSYKEKREKEVILYIALAILFQPIFKIALGRTIWNIVDVIIAIYLVISTFQKTKK
ncbi:MAG TPA: DUF6804 family protein [Moheibacter sp.]|nr:DUF6804 family protein [Moheibacter sp.]